MYVYIARYTCMYHVNYMYMYVNLCNPIVYFRPARKPVCRSTCSRIVYVTITRLRSTPQLELTRERPLKPSIASVPTIPNTPLNEVL